MSEVKEIQVCDYKGRDNEPCYGDIDSFWDGDKWITFCEGHKAVPHNGGYVPKDPIRRWIFSEQNKKIIMLKAEIEYLKDNADMLRRVLLLQDVQIEIEIPKERMDILNYV